MTENSEDLWKVRKAVSTMFSSTLPADDPWVTDRQLEELIDALDEREKGVLTAHFGIGKFPDSLASIGSEYGVSRQRAKQVLDKSVAKIGRKIMSIIVYGEDVPGKPVEPQSVKPKTVSPNLLLQLQELAKLLGSANSILNDIDWGDLDDPRLRIDKDLQVDCFDQIEKIQDSLEALDSLEKSTGIFDIEFPEACT